MARFGVGEIPVGLQVIFQRGHESACQRKEDDGWIIYEKITPPERGVTRGRKLQAEIKN